jgi:hypothetical protein
MIHRGSYRPYIAHTLDPCRGSEGHAFVALLAETRLTENTKKGICSLIGDARRGLRLVRDEGDGRVTHFPASQTIALGGS